MSGFRSATRAPPRPLQRPHAKREIDSEVTRPRSRPHPSRPQTGFASGRPSPGPAALFLEEKTNTLFGNYRQLEAETRGKRHTSMPRWISMAQRSASTTLANSGPSGRRHLRVYRRRTTWRHGICEGLSRHPRPRCRRQGSTPIRGGRAQRYVPIPGMLRMRRSAPSLSGALASIHPD
jgi:hypothetical protein